MDRVVLRGGLVVDGTGAKAQRADVLIEGTHIAAVGEDVGVDRDTPAVDLDGLVLAPGFIDPHTHYDAQVLWDPAVTPSSWHGVTTTIMGNCGFGIAPSRPEHRPTIMRVLENVEGMPYDALEEGIRWGFETFPEYLSTIDGLPLRVNVAAFIGHTPLRYFVMGDEATERPATTDEVALMRSLVDEAMGAGAIGFSTSRSAGHVGAYGRPVPSRAAELHEISELLEPLRLRRAGLFQSTFGPDLHVEEFAEIARRIDRPVTWVAITAERRSPGAAVKIAERAGELEGQVFPQISCKPIVVEISLDEPFPLATAAAFTEVLATDREHRAERYADPGWRRRAGNEVEAQWGPILDTAVVTASDAHPDLVEGPTLGEVARRENRTAIEVMADLALAEGLRTKFRVAMVNDDEEQLAELLRQPHLLLGLSDAGAHTGQLCDSNYATHMLGYWWRTRGALPLEQAVWRLTGHPAHVFGLHDRGRILPGLAADLVAFEPERIGTGPVRRTHDFPGGCDRLVAPSEGIVHMWVNGTPVRQDGWDRPEHAPGRLLRSTS